MYGTGNLKTFEFLDLYKNHLCGKIPSSLAFFFFNGRLSSNLLFKCNGFVNNNLIGKISIVAKLQSFDTSSYEDCLDL
jgi:hypothetical protein